MKRVLEKEVMDDEENVVAYSTTEFNSNKVFVDLFVKEFHYVKNILDLRCGPADIPIKLVKVLPSVKITALDASKLMLEFAKKNIKENKVEDKIKVIQKNLNDLNLKGDFDCIISKDVLHHLPDPFSFWKKIKGFVGRECVIFVFDLIRPETEEEVKRIIDEVDYKEKGALVKDYYNSLKAAFTLDEIKNQLKTVGLKLEVIKISDIQFIIKGIVKK